MAEAKVYAEQELDKYRKQYEEEYQTESEKKSKENAQLSHLEEEAARDIEEIKVAYEKNKAKVMEELIRHVLEINIEVPRVVIGKFE